MDMKKERRKTEDISLLFLHTQEEEEDCLIQNILVWLPVVSLLRFKAVSKYWRAFIQSPSFIDLHTTATMASSSSKFGSFILEIYCRLFPPLYSRGHFALLMLSLSSQSESSESGGGGGGSNDDQEEEAWPVVVMDDLVFDMNTKRVVGSCNGLVCLIDTNLEYKADKVSQSDQVSLWNPATRQQCMSLPEESKTIPPRATYNLVGFGFDVETKDYKVVQFTGLKSKWNGKGPKLCFCQVQVYSLSTHSWRRLEGIPCLPGYPFQMATDGVQYLNGTCFFLAHFFHTKRRPCLAKNNRFIISFDFTKEILTPIQLPDHHRDQLLCLCSWGDDKLVLFTSPHTRPFKGLDPPIGYWGEFNVWVLNYERGSSVNKDSWKKLHTFKIQLESQSDWYEPRGISNDGKFALLESGCGDTMNLYNFATEEMKRDSLFCKMVTSKAHAYKPSLVSVIGGNGAGRSSSSR